MWFRFSLFSHGEETPACNIYIYITTDSFLFVLLHNINKQFFYVYKWKGNFPSSGVSRDSIKASPDVTIFLRLFRFLSKTLEKNFKFLFICESWKQKKNDSHQLQLLRSNRQIPAHHNDFTSCGSDGNIKAG